MDIVMLEEGTIMIVEMEIIPIAVGVMLTTRSLIAVKIITPVMCKRATTITIGRTAMIATIITNIVITPLVIIIKGIITQWTITTSTALMTIISIRMIYKIQINTQCKILISMLCKVI